MANIERPRVICHMMTTINGKITGAKGVDVMSDDFFSLYTETEDLLPAHTGWLLGRVTMQMFASEESTGLEALSMEIGNSDFVSPHEGSLYMFAVDTKGLLRWKDNSIKLSNVSDPLHLVVVVTETTPKEYLQYLQTKNISYLFAGEERIDFPKLLSSIKQKMNVDTLLLEGGGLMNGSAMSADVVDEISLLLTPKVVNQGLAPTMFEGDDSEPLDVKDYSLAEVKQMEKDCVWLQYKRKNQ